MFQWATCIPNVTDNMFPVDGHGKNTTFFFFENIKTQIAFVFQSQETNKLASIIPAFQKKKSFKLLASFTLFIETIQ